MLRCVLCRKQDVAACQKLISGVSKGRACQKLKIKDMYAKKKLARSDLRECNR